MALTVSNHQQNAARNTFTTTNSTRDSKTCRPLNHSW